MEFSGFVGPSYVTRLLQTSAEECINLMPVTLESPNANPRRILRKVPGLTNLFTGLAGAIRGLFAQDGRSFVVADGTVYETTTGAAVTLGTIASDGKPVSWATNGSQNAAGGHQVLLCSAGTLYVMDLNTGAVPTLVAGAAFMQGSVLNVEYMDGLFLAATLYKVYQSAAEDGTTWNAANTAARSIATDNLVRIINNYPQHTLWVFGTLRTEVWYDNGGAVFSFGPIPGVFVNVGLAATSSLVRGDGTLMWLGVDETGSRVVYEAQQYTPMRISNDAVEFDLAQFGSVSDFVGSVYQEEGHTFYCLTSLLNQRTWVFDRKERLWHKRGAWIAASGSFQQAPGLLSLSQPNVTWIGDGATGTVYTQSLNALDYAGNTLRWLRRFPHVTQQQHRVFYPGFVLDGQKGIGLSTGQGSNPQVMLRWSNDGGETWSNEAVRSLGALGSYSARTYWYKLGQGRNRVWEVSGSDPIALALTGVYLDPDPVVGAN